ncbi:hypothetical protein NX79_08570 [Xanthomonas vasicola]|nr:hypothetical protein NX04_05790 [Xanthomonas vasicola]KGR47423.1 hypothetical protein NX05_03170 [Xanthomonas vasicola]KGR60848.1 hypothetical protein NX79_08570 [Xanthomonas vasicola]
MLIAVQTDTTFTAPSFVVIEPVRSFDNASLTDWTVRRLAPECEVYTDGLACFHRLEEAGHAHTRWTPVVGALRQKLLVPAGSTLCWAT